MNPVESIALWIEEARAAGEREPEAMALATADVGGRPSVRFVLCRGVDARGLRFFTNFGSRKGTELQQNPQAAVVFLWQSLGRQVRVEGEVERLDPAESDAYFAARPRGHQLGAWASPQSRPVSRDQLERRYAELEREQAGRPIARPDFWGGYRLIARALERWERASNRLHHRTRWERAGDLWTPTTLAP